MEPGDTGSRPFDEFLMPLLMHNPVRFGEGSEKE